MNNRILRPLARPLLLDAVPGAAAAYSLRQLSNSYAGPVVTVRRSSDDAEADFKASEIDDGTLAAFCGAGDGFVKTWHDQSGNNRDASATGTAQPKIVDSGSLVTEGGMAALQFDGSDDRLVGSPINVDCTQRVLSVACLKESMRVQVRSVGNGNNLELQPTDVSLFTNGTSYTSGSFSGTEMFLITAEVPSATSFFSFLNGGALQSEVGIGPTDDVFASNINIGFRETDAGADQQGPAGYITELVFWSTDSPVSLQRIEGDLAWYY